MSISALIHMYIYIYLIYIYIYTSFEVGEKTFVWVIQNDAHDDPPSTRIALPTWISRDLEIRICRFAKEHDHWQSVIEKRSISGKLLTKSQQDKFTIWQANCVQRLVFNKRRQCLVNQAKSVTKDCIVLQLNLSADPEELTLCAGMDNPGQKFRLVLLRQCTSPVPAGLPDVLDHEYSSTDLEHARDLFTSAEPEAENVDELDEMNQKAMDEERHAVLDPIGDQDDELIILADSDEDGEALGLPKQTPKVKSFFLRPAWDKLDKLGLTDLPRHVHGCSIGCHVTSQQWQGFYPNATSRLSCYWGKATKRSEEEALLSSIRGILESHVAQNAKDKVWSRQLAKVKEAEAKLSL